MQGRFRFPWIDHFRQPQKVISGFLGLANLRILGMASSALFRMAELSSHRLGHMSKVETGVDLRHFHPLLRRKVITHKGLKMTKMTSRRQHQKKNRLTRRRFGLWITVFSDPSKVRIFGCQEKLAGTLAALSKVWTPQITHRFSSREKFLSPKFRLTHTTSMIKILALGVLHLCWVFASTPADVYWKDEVTGQLVAGTKKCKEDDFPFMVFFTDKKCVPSLCSGSLISQEWVLTSKECVDHYLSNSLWNDRTRKFLCLLAATHSEGSLGLVKIEKVDPFPDHILLVHYHQTDLFPPIQDGGDTTSRGDSPDMGTVVGFQNHYVSLERGRRNTTHFKKHNVASMKRLALPLMSGEECVQNISELFNENAVVCTACDFGGSNTCLIDSGGPLLYNDRILGVISGSQSKHCFFRNSLAVYTKVSPYVTWIESTLQIQPHTDRTTSNFDRSLIDTDRDYDGDTPRRHAGAKRMSPSLILSVVVLTVLRSPPLLKVLPI
ncbi:hypothetical protein M8J76_013630 [Diaphorina citri]|nr:hypothetical protein M8J76_013630 [Diaphorina citri]